IIGPAAETQSLTRLATVEGFERNARNACTLLIGVDIRCDMPHFKLKPQGENPELRRMFFKFCRFLKIPATLIFVFDSPGHPPVKRGKDVRNTPLWVISHLKFLITTFGFYIHEVPGEAEAELAMLNQLGIIDAIITNDSDTFVFGAKCVIRSSSMSKWGNGLGGDEASIYSSETIENVDTVALTPGGLLLMALIAGSNYDSGILGYGASTTHGLAKCGFGDALLTAANALPDNDCFQMFLSAWRAQMHLELSTNSRGFLPRRSIVRASKLKVSAFPNVDVLNLYLHPKTSWTVGLGAHVRDTVAPSWKLCEPVIHEITTFCQQRLGWSDLAALLKRFENVLWGGVICRMFCLVCKLST
ncbi:PIN domain-like protein, partial [Tricholoma matsutake]